MILSRNKDSREKSPEPASADEASAKAPIVRAKLEALIDVLAGLESEQAALALAAAEERPNAVAKLTAHRSKVDAAAREVAEMQAALALAEQIDRQTAASAAIRMRAEQLIEFKKPFSAREKAMAAVLKAAAEMAAAYAEYSEATLSIQISVPTGTVIPVMMIGPEGIYGAAFGPCERLILAELYRLAPERSDGIGRFVLPFSRPSSEQTRGHPAAIRPGIEELVAADKAIISEIELQIEKLNGQTLRAAGVPADDQKDAA
jgi:hypothetical protein